jgi:hypothetical protein
MEEEGRRGEQVAEEKCVLRIAMTCILQLVRYYTAGEVQGNESGNAARKEEKGNTVYLSGNLKGIFT